LTVLEDVETVPGDAPERALHVMENVVCPKTGRDCCLSPVEPLQESPFVLDTVHEDTSVAFQLTNVDSPLRNIRGATLQLIMFGGEGVDATGEQIGAVTLQDAG
jgi:hypothetical protein